MEEYIKGVNGENICLEAVMVSDLDFCDIDDEYVEKADLSRPVIMAEISPGQYSLIDGRHRVVKAKKRGFRSLMAYKVPMEHHIKFLTERRGYEAYVEYRNEKLRALARQKIRFRATTVLAE